MNNEIILAVIHALGTIIAYSVPSIVAYAFLRSRLKSIQHLNVRLQYARDLKFMNAVERRLLEAAGLNKAEVRKAVEAEVGWEKSVASEDARLDRDINRLQQRNDDVSSHGASFNGIF
jgi:hypothetical protein